MERCTRPGSRQRRKLAALAMGFAPTPVSDAVEPAARARGVPLRPRRGYAASELSLGSCPAPFRGGAGRTTALGKRPHLAVDTHGYTDFAMLLAKLLGFDLCPRLRDLKQRKLYVPAGFDVPENLLPVTVRSLRLELFEEWWDELTRLAASVLTGKTSAIDVMFRFGAAARGLPLYDACVHAGKLLRTLFLCDWYTKPVFQRELGGMLSRGEPVYTLQRTLHDGKMPRSSSRRGGELDGVSASLTLLCNIVMAWNTARMQTALDGLPLADKQLATPDNLRHTAPVHNGHINIWSPAAKASTRSGPDGRMSRATSTVSAPAVAAKAVPKARATFGLSWSGTVPRMSYALTMSSST